MSAPLVVSAIALLLLCAMCAADDDILINDFEAEDYGDWQVTSEAFGPGPATGTLPNQMEVSGYEGERLVNTFSNGDGTQGTLTSPEFTIERSFITFLIGGGMHPGETCVNLLVDGEMVRTATGPNDRPGGTEKLDWYCWEVQELQGKAASLEIVDEHQGGWGHINVDHILQSNTPRGRVVTVTDLLIEEDYLAMRMPADEWPHAYASLSIDGEPARSHMAAGRLKPYWVSWDVSALKGKVCKLDVSETPVEGRRGIRDTLVQRDEPKGILIVTDKLYQESYRPQFHFSAKKNWHNDPNGLMFYKGEYHLFIQHNPQGINWGNMTWGHAVSKDLVHWTQIDHAIYPDELGTIFSGSGVVDWGDTAGFKTGDEEVLVCIYTSAGGTNPESEGQPFTQSIAYSNDRGRTWEKHEGNPVLGHIAGSNRDPKVIRHEPTGKWIMALYLDGNDYGLYSSPDLKEWTPRQELVVEGATECPDFFELPIDGDPSNTRWVYWGANGRYGLGSFDGTKFTQEGETLPSTDAGGNFYAAQTWSDIPEEDGRRIQIAWMNGGQYPDMPFNQQMSFPCELTLRSTPDGIRLYREPVGEIKTLHAKQHEWKGEALKPGEDLLDGLRGDLWHLEAELEPGEASELGFDIRGEKLTYNVAEEKLTCLGRTAEVPLEEGALKLEVLVDRTSIEVYCNDGWLSMTTCFLPDLGNTKLGAYAVGGEATVRSLKVWKLKSAWPE